MNNTTRLKMLLADSPVGTVLPAIAQVNLPNWWLAGGAVRNTVWHSIFGKECGLFIKDFDIAFFDAQGERSQESPYNAWGFIIPTQRLGLHKTNF